MHGHCTEKGGCVKESEAQRRLGGAPPSWSCLVKKTLWEQKAICDWSLAICDWLLTKPFAQSWQIAKCRQSIAKCFESRSPPPNLQTVSTAITLNSKIEGLRFLAQQCGAGVRACWFAGLSSPASGRLESRPNWQTRMSAPRKHPCRFGGQLGIQDYRIDLSTGSSTFQTFAATARWPSAVG